MKKLSLWIAAFSTCFIFTAQAQVTQTTNNGVPQAIPYSSLVKDASGMALSNQFIKLRFSMHSGSATGPVVYCETDTTTTSPTGIFSVVVGGGTIMSGTFDAIPWSTSQIYQQVELDPTGASNFADMGTTQLLSSP